MGETHTSNYTPTLGKKDCKESHREVPQVSHLLSPVPSLQLDAGSLGQVSVHWPATEIISTEIPFVGHRVVCVTAPRTGWQRLQKAV